MTTSRRALFACLAVALAAAPFPAAPRARTAAPRDAGEILARYGGLDAEEIAAVERGAPAARTLAPADQRELAVFGVVRVEVTKDAFLARFRDIARFKRGENVLQVGKFRTPPRREDVRGLTLEAGDLEDLRGCAPGRCEVRSPDEASGRLFARLDWASPGAPARANGAFRDGLWRCAAAYLRSGNAALASFEEGGRTVSVGDEARALVEASALLRDLAPELAAYLTEYRGRGLAGAEDFLYWSKETFGLEPVVTLTHVTIYRPGGPAGDTALVTSRQVYASRYFDASLGLTVLVDAAAAGGPPATYIIYVSRSRTPALLGPFQGVKRSLVEHEAVLGMKSNLRLLRDRLESAAPARRRA